MNKVIKEIPMNKTLCAFGRFCNIFYSFSKFYRHNYWLFSFLWWVTSPKLAMKWRDVVVLGFE